MNIFKGCYGRASCFSTPDNPLLQFFLLPDVLPHSCWVKCFVSSALAAKKSRSEEWFVCGYCSARPVHSDFHGSQHGAVMFVPIPVWVTAAPGWVCGHSYLHHRGTVPIPVTAGGCISEIWTFIKKNHFKPTQLDLRGVDTSFLIPRWEMAFLKAKLHFWYYPVRWWHSKCIF